MMAVSVFFFRFGVENPFFANSLSVIGRLLDCSMVSSGINSSAGTRKAGDTTENITAGVISICIKKNIRRRQEMTDELKEINKKLDIIIRFFNMDGKGKLPVSIKQEAHERIIKILDRRNRRKEMESV
jgi:hypothetical protein